MLPLLLLLLVLPLGEAQAEQQPSSVSEDEYVVPNSIKGRVVDSGAEPLPGIEVILEQPKTGLKRSVTTDKDGRYHFDCLNQGQYGLTFKYQGFITERMGNFTYRPPDTLRLDRKLELDPASADVFIFPSDEPHRAFDFTVKDSASTGSLPNVHLILSDLNGSSRESSATNACGIARVYLEPRKRYLVRLQKAGFRDKEITIDMLDKPMKLNVNLDPIR